MCDRIQNGYSKRIRRVKACLPRIQRAVTARKGGIKPSKDLAAIQHHFSAVDVQGVVHQRTLFHTQPDFRQLHFAAFDEQRCIVPGDKYHLTLVPLTIDFEVNVYDGALAV